MCATSENPETARDWFRPGVCAFLIAVALLCGVLGTWVRGAVRQRGTVAALTRADEDVTVKYGYELDDAFEWVGGEPPRPPWLRELLGIDFFATVRAVDIPNATDARWSR